MSKANNSICFFLFNGLNFVIIFEVIQMKKIAGISIFVLIIDQLLKLLVSSLLKLNTSKEIISNFFNISLVHNNGAAWSILSGNRLLLILISISALVLIYYLFIKDKELTSLEIVTYGMLIGGILGNLLDRILYGYVIDFLDFNILGYRYPVFNFADCCIVISALLLIIGVIREGIVCKKSS